ncbi:MAG: RIP metalloprotease RseP [Deltaproteobacteria bacterium]|nr:RIP metalloprotease RseP [Deltaproteobacteria bacterium]
MIFTILVTVVVLGVLIFFHELGHFLMCKVCGVGVEIFSLGFGPRVFGRRVNETDYRLSAVPLGGFVKMIGEGEELEVKPEDIPKSFSHKKVGQRILIVAAGPIFNIIFAVLAFFVILFFYGAATTNTVIGGIESGSPAYQAKMLEGDQIMSMDGRPTETWDDLVDHIKAGNGQPIKTLIRRGGRDLELTITPRQEKAANIFGEEEASWSIGITPYGSEIGGMKDNLPAQVAGLQVGDRILAINSQPVSTWTEMAKIIHKSGGKPLDLKILRRGAEIQRTVMPKEDKGVVDASGESASIWVIGITPLERQSVIKKGFFHAITGSVDATWFYSKISVLSIVKMFKGTLSVKQVGGPIMIAQMAGKQARAGLSNLIFLMAVISINLAILNLLPIPVLDGGHLFFFVLESILGHPLSLKKRERAQQVGLFFLLLLMGVVFYNDIARVVTSGF